MFLLSLSFTGFMNWLFAGIIVLVVLTALYELPSFSALLIASFLVMLGGLILPGRFFVNFQIFV